MHLLANTIETTLDTAMPVVTVKTFPGLVSSNSSHLLPALVNKPDAFVTKLEFVILCHQDEEILSLSSSYFSFQFFEILYDSKFRFGY